MSRLRQHAGAVGVRTKQANYAAAQTATALVAAPGAGNRIHVHRFDLSAAAACRAFLHDEDDVQVGRDVQAPTAGEGGYKDVDLPLGVNKALEVTTSLAGVHSVYVEYSIRQDGAANRARGFQSL
jgi:hypothetical protein